jgi:flagellar motor switch/type III secretory pathway protein FliN
VTVSGFKSWLPKGALDASAIDRVFSEAVRSWSEKWFARNGPRPLGPFAPGLAGKAVQREGLSWHVLDSGLALSVADRATGLLAASILDADLSGVVLTPRDRKLIERVASDCLADLRTAVTERFAIGSVEPWRTGEQPGFASVADSWSASLGMNDREPLLRIVAGHDLMIAFRKASIPPQPRPAVLGSLSKGLEGQELGLSALLGRCRMNLSDLGALEEGDVLILDRQTDSKLELAVDGEAKGGSCTLEQQGERFALKISNPLAG